MMNEFKSAKESYENTPIPQELDARVQAGIREGKARYQARRGRTFRRWASAAACFCAVLAGLNLSPTVAKAAAGVPVLGGLFQILTFVDYDKTEDGIHYDVSVPRVEADSGLAEKVNAAVQERVDAHLAKAGRTGTTTGRRSLPPAARKRSGPAGKWTSSRTMRSKAGRIPGSPLW